MGVSLYILIIFWITHISVSNAKICPIDQCSQCDDTAAFCTISETSMGIPEEVPASIPILFIMFTGPPQMFSMSLIKRFNRLGVLGLEGNLIGLENETLPSHITDLHITRTEIETLPTRLFGGNSNIQLLDLAGSNLRKMPESNLLQNLKNLRVLLLGHNPIENICTQSQLNEEFRELKSLHYLNLNGLGDIDKCGNLTDTFFAPVSHITKLELSESGFFSGSLQLLKVFQNLTTLFVENVEPFRSCPALAAEMFSSLPPGLSWLRSRNWQSSLPLNKSCLLTGEKLSALKQSPNLTHIDFTFSEKVFGNVLNAQTLAGFARLEILELVDTGFAEIEYGALNEARQLQFLDLTGNRIGPRQFEAITVGSEPLLKLTTLKLNNCGLSLSNSFVFDGGFLFYNFPNLQELFMSQNDLHHIPILSSNARNSTVVEKLDLSFNSLTACSGYRMQNICQVMPKLATLDISSNSIATITDLCSSLKSLDVSNNLLGSNRDLNLAALQQLTQLEELDLSNNELVFIPHNAFKNMRLVKLYLKNNFIYSLDNDLLAASLDTLVVLDLSRNRISNFDDSLISKHKSLRELYLHNNLITRFTEEFTNFTMAVMESIDPNSNNMFSTATIRVHNNPLDCSCHRLYFQNWVKSCPYLYKANELRCETPKNQHGNFIYDYNDPIWECYVKWPLIIIPSVILCAGCLLIVALPCDRYRWYVSHFRTVCRAMIERAKDIRIQDEYKYDAIICYNQDSQVDKNWAELLLETLERGLDPDNNEDPHRQEQQCRVYLHCRDGVLGSYRYQSLCDAMRQSRKIIILLSNSFLTSNECMAEAIYAGGEVHGSKVYHPDRTLILILDELKDNLILDPAAQSLLTETVIELSERVRLNESKMKPIWKRINKFVMPNSKPLIYRRKVRRNGYESI